MKRLLAAALVFALLLAPAGLQAADKGKAKAAKAPVKKTVVPGAKAPVFSVINAKGKVVKLKSLTDKGPVLVRLTCGCSGCDKELAYFQELHKAYKGQGLTSVAIFREPDKKVEGYVKKKNLKMLYAVDSKGKAWAVWQTKKMPTNFLIAKGGTIIAIADGCDPSGLLAKKLSEKVAKLLKTDAVNVQQVVKEQAKKSPAPKK